MNEFSQLFSTSNIMLCLAIVAIVWIQRKGLEVFFKRVFRKNLKKSVLWTEFIMPIGPLVTGALIVLIPQLPIPQMFSGGMAAKMVFGIGLGMISGLVYRLVKKNILDKLSKSTEKTPYNE